MGRDAIDINVLKNCPTTESEDGQPIGQRITPFFDDVPQMLEDIDETMYQARLYHDAVVHSDAEVGAGWRGHALTGSAMTWGAAAYYVLVLSGRHCSRCCDSQAAQHPAEVWNTVARPSPVYISDRMDVEKGAGPAAGLRLAHDTDAAGHPADAGPAAQSF